MKAQSVGFRGPLVVALVAGLLLPLPFPPGAEAKGSKGGHARAGHAGGGHPARPAHPSHPPKAPKATRPRPPKTPHAHTPAPARGSARPNAHARRPNTAATARGATAPNATPRPRANANARANRATSTRNAQGLGLGSGAGRGGARPGYRVRGYGRGYRNRSYLGRRGYGTSHGNNRSIVGRLRSVHAGLARLDHNYQGHRTRAMHAVALAVRQLSHRSMISRGTGFGSGPGLAGVGGRRGLGVNGVNAANNRPKPKRKLTQAQSDARMNQARQTLVGIGRQLSGPGYPTPSHARAHGHVVRAVRELNAALAVR